MARVTIRLDLADVAAEPRLGRIGSGKIALLDAIAREGSISAGARAQKLSYRRAWIMVDEMNRLFREPVIEAEMGGARGGSAALTPVGTLLVSSFRAIESLTQAYAAREIEKLAKLLR